LSARILLHAGAGAWKRAELLDQAVAACVEAAEAGRSILAAGGSALDAVEAAVRVLEDCPVLDAGRGSYRTTAGNIEMDALIMDGRNLDLGAVAAVEHLRHPISLARCVMQDSPHALLVGSGASAFADAMGLPRCRLEDLLPDGEAVEERPADAANLGDTVGAVALDAAGHLAAATSTGGMRGQMPGRVGDSPLVGAGGYADDRGAAVSATGQGEALMKVLISKRVNDLCAQGIPVQAACEASIAELAERTGAEGGLIALDAAGRMGLYHNTAAMPFAQATAAGEITSGPGIPSPPGP
jgi:beta-aspartyl-peptidase (threonine type)